MTVYFNRFANHVGEVVDVVFIISQSAGLLADSKHMFSLLLLVELALYHQFIVQLTLFHH